MIYSVSLSLVFLTHKTEVVTVPGGGGVVAKSCPALVTASRPLPAPIKPRTVAHQAPLSMGFLRQEYWSGLPFLSPGHLSEPGTELTSPALQADSLYLSHQGSPIVPTVCLLNI